MQNQRNSGRASRPLFAFGAVVGIAVALLVRAIVAQVYFVPSASMQPTLHVGDRVLVDKVSSLWRPVSRGDVVVFDATDVWGSATNHLLVAKRVIGVAGDRVRCCTESGDVLVNGARLREPYVAAGARGRAFDVTVPAGRIWVLGDARAQSLDSSAYVQTPGGGSVPVNHVVGRVVAVVWPLQHAGILSTPNAKDAHDPA